MSLFPKSKILNIRGELLSIDTPKVMGILNITPDSFYDGGRYTSDKNQLNQVEQMLEQGADFIDIGAQSTRPGAIEHGADYELELLIPAIANIRKHFPKAILSIDTWHAKVAKEVALNGANMINDISGGVFDKDMFATIAEINLPYIVMHTGGKPGVMQQNPKYNDVLKEVIYFMSEQREKLNLLGVNDVIFDPGFGFISGGQDVFVLSGGLLKSIGGGDRVYPYFGGKLIFFNGNRQDDDTVSLVPVFGAEVYLTNRFSLIGESQMVIN